MESNEVRKIGSEKYNLNKGFLSYYPDLRQWDVELGLHHNCICVVEVELVFLKDWFPT